MRPDSTYPVCQDVYDLASPEQRQYLVVRSEEMHTVYEAKSKSTSPVQPQKEGRAAAAKGNDPHRSTKVYSELIGRWFDSKGELRRGELLYFRQKAGEIKCLEFQNEYVLSVKPKVTISVDFRYLERQGDEWIPVDEDCKGWKLTKKTKRLVPRVERDFRVKMAWLKEKFNIDVRLVK